MLSIFAQGRTETITGENIHVIIIPTQTLCNQVRIKGDCEKESSLCKQTKVPRQGFNSERDQ